MEQNQSRSCWSGFRIPWATEEAAPVTSSFWDRFFSSGVFCAVAITVLCGVYASRLSGGLVFCKKKQTLAKRSKNKACSCSCSCKAFDSFNAWTNNLVNGERVERLLQHPPGASMMEQLVPEITTHALSYLDYPSLCRLSMTNSSMRRAANDDNAWKALYHKDFTTEQGIVSPPNGWKSYYAATKAVVDVNADYYNILRARNIVEMSRLWLRADYVKCVHPRGLLLSGYVAVMQSWELAFNWNQQYECQLSDIRVRVVGGMAWVTLKEYVNAALEPFLVTNIYELHDRQWFMVHHHSSPILEAGAADHGIFGG